MPLRREMIESFLKEQLAKVLRTSPERIDPTSPLSRQGLDSLMSIELRNRLESQLRIALSPLLTWKYPTITAMVSHLAEKMNVPIETDSPPYSPQPLETELVRAQLQQLSESELGAKLAARLQALNEI
jgi:myxalamid-type polyketide synthase MxaE and MxaD